jgi:hypothetical protein
MMGHQRCQAQYPDNQTIPAAKINTAKVFTNL